MSKQTKGMYWYKKLKMMMGQNMMEFKYSRHLLNAKVIKEDK